MLSFQDWRPSAMISLGGTGIFMVESELQQRKVAKGNVGTWSLAINRDAQFVLRKLRLTRYPTTVLATRPI
jgi:hypothetical protein